MRVLLIQFNYHIAHSQMLSIFNLHVIVLSTCVICSAENCLDMLDTAQKAFEEENKFNNDAMVH